MAAIQRPKTDKPARPLVPIGAQRNIWGNDRLNAWRHHFEKARAADSVEDIRAEQRRHLKICARLAQELSLSAE